MRRALISVTDKTGVTDFARELVRLGFQIISTGGTARTLREAGISVTEVREVTGFPEILDGRVKTLHPAVHGGLLAKRNDESHQSQLQEHGIESIDLLCINLYQFEEAVNSGADFDAAIEAIDIGGPAMIRAAAKNSASVSVVVDPEDYDAIIKAIEANQTSAINRKLQAKAFRHTAYYDAAIAQYLTSLESDLDFSEKLAIPLARGEILRYGENPHQRGAIYRQSGVKGGVANALLLHGVKPSYNNYLDADAAWGLVCELPIGSCAIIKHGNPCGVAQLSNFAESYRLARSCDPISAYGGIAAFNGVVEESAALAMAEKGNFLEVVVAEGFTSEAVETFANRTGWGQSVRLLSVTRTDSKGNLTIRSISGGALVQDSDAKLGVDWQVVTKRAPTDAERRALELQWVIAKHVKSNAIVIGDPVRLLGVGAGQMNRVQSVRLAIDQAGDFVRGAVLASDAFFPFPDSIEVAAEAGITAIVEPGGSKKDADVIEAANSHGIALVFTGIRHFRH